MKRFMHRSLHRILFAAIGILMLGLIAGRIQRYANFEPAAGKAMPAALSDAEERELFHEPAGKYTSADIAANGPQLPAEKYRQFRASHNFRPQPGDRLCPVTRTKANSQCTWIVNGETYEFCCPPCIPEFVRLAKTAPREIEPAATYVQQAVAAQSD
jgi:hypothetical protein